MGKVKIFIDPRLNIAYDSFYLYGLKMKYGQRNIHYTMRYFRDLPDGGNLRYVWFSDGIIKKYVVHIGDSYKINQAEYDWCDKYGSVNANFFHYPKDRYHKLCSLVPSFAIKNYNLFQTLSFSIVTFFLSMRYIISRERYNMSKDCFEINSINNIRRHFINYLKNWKQRLPYEDYLQRECVKNKYVFFLCTLWQSDEDHDNDNGVNQRRYKFIRACKSIQDLTFKGGLLGSAISSNEKFIDAVTTERMSFREWLTESKRSAVVFNTPAFYDCHGWKLGEYLAMGKAIISTKLYNDLPFPLENGKQVIFVQNDEIKMRDAIVKVINDEQLRIDLENSARDYWERYGTPIKSIELLES